MLDGRASEAHRVMLIKLACDLVPPKVATTASMKRPGGGLIVLPDAFNASHLQQIIELAARYRLPAIYPVRDYANEGGLMSYGTDPFDIYGRAVSYVDQILKGANPANLPVQSQTKYALVINLKTAKALGGRAAIASKAPPSSTSITIPVSSQPSLATRRISSNRPILKFQICLVSA
jgi:ABC-type uncharacterized transport system substrate-binding protein